jgi:phosphoglycolate phosphatase-like HAD superfamily hydrolase
VKYCRKCCVFDLDGTLCDSSSRLRSISFTPESPLTQFKDNWGDLSKDLPIKKSINFLNELGKSLRIVILTLRSENQRASTKEWLINNNVLYDELIMVGDFCFERSLKPEEAKAQYFESNSDLLENTMAVFEDSDSIINRLRELGLLCLSVGKNEFSS